MSWCRGSHTAVGSMDWYNSLAKYLGSSVRPCTSQCDTPYHTAAASREELHSTCVAVMSLHVAPYAQLIRCAIAREHFSVISHLFCKSTWPSAVPVPLTLTGCKHFGEEPPWPRCTRWCSRGTVNQCYWLEMTSRCCVNSYLLISFKASHTRSIRWGGQKGIACEELSFPVQSSEGSRRISCRSKTAY